MRSINKVLNALPATLEPNSIYYVRAGTGHRTYVTTAAGIPIAQNQTNVIEKSNRWTLRADGLWTGQGINRGLDETNQTTTYGGGATPTPRWNMIGPLLLPTMRITRFQFSGTVNNTQVQNLDWVLGFQYGSWGNSWDTNAETTFEVIDSGTQGTNAGDQFRSSTLTTLDYVVPQQGYLGVFYRGNGTLTTNRFARLTTRIEYELNPLILD